MNYTQIQALEALYLLASGKYGTLVDLRRLTIAIHACTLDDLVEQGFIRSAGQGNITITQQGTEKASENRQLSSVDSKL